MKCPIDDSPLSVSARDGVEIDFCPQCRGVWLDRGELDKIIDRAAAALASAAVPATQAYSAPEPPRRDDRDDRYRDERPRDDRYRDDRYRGYDERKKRKRSFLDDIFDFD